MESHQKSPESSKRSLQAEDDDSRPSKKPKQDTEVQSPKQSNSKDGKPFKKWNQDRSRKGDSKMHNVARKGRDKYVIRLWVLFIN